MCTRQYIGFNHSGWLPGYQSVANYHSDIDAVVIQFINTTGGSSESTASLTYEKILRLLRKLKVFIMVTKIFKVSKIKYY